MEARKKVFSRNKGEAYVYPTGQEAERREAASISEAFIYKLAHKLGGREEVVNGKAVELLKFMEMALEEDEAKIEEQQATLFMNHISRINARAPQDKREAKAQHEFAKSIQPKPKIKQGPTKVYEWDVEQLKRLASK